MPARALARISNHSSSSNVERKREARVGDLDSNDAAALERELVLAFMYIIVALYPNGTTFFSRNGTLPVGFQAPRPVVPEPIYEIDSISGNAARDLAHWDAVSACGKELGRFGGRFPRPKSARSTSCRGSSDEVLTKESIWASWTPRRRWKISARVGACVVWFDPQLMNPPPGLLQLTILRVNSNLSTLLDISDTSSTMSWNLREEELIMEDMILLSWSLPALCIAPGRLSCREQGRFTIDFVQYTGMKKAEKWPRGDLGLGKLAFDGMGISYFSERLPSALTSFDLNSKSGGELAATHMSPLKWNAEAFDTLLWMMIRLRGKRSFIYATIRAHVTLLENGATLDGPREARPSRSLEWPLPAEASHLQLTRSMAGWSYRSRGISTNFSSRRDSGRNWISGDGGERIASPIVPAHPISDSTTNWPHTKSHWNLTHTQRPITRQEAQPSVRPSFAMSSSEEPSVVSVEYLGRVAVITIANEKKLNALTQGQYFDLAQRLREVATKEEVCITVLTGKGRYFSAGADVSISREAPSQDAPDSTYNHWLRSFVANNLNLTQAFYTHPKILVVALNGPAIGLSAAITGFADFVYCTPSAFLLTPFSSLGLVAEGGASHSLVQRLGISKANEALIMSKRISCDELLACGFVNKVFDPKEGGADKFREMVLEEVDERLGHHLVASSLTGIKKLIRKPEVDRLNAQSVEEVFSGLERFMSGVPQGEFIKIASGEKRHKL
ncbi:enoyl-CoA hydratase/isomerase [Zalerion maritima]|uniref:Enoyl-CoA hydratase/isomerase n=1 Tax=Zalerion maritima TaxID=339359 RepID=A0AAD5WYS0_9PEZI|nr:enoyl-CoA hydratase/isomerase [Zalerion maritima]